MAEDIKALLGGILDSPISKEQRLAIVAVQCAAEVTAGVGTQHPIVGANWQQQLSDYQQRLSEEIFQYLKSKP